MKKPVIRIILAFTTLLFWTAVGLAGTFLSPGNLTLSLDNADGGKINPNNTFTLTFTNTLTKPKVIVNRLSQQNALGECTIKNNFGAQDAVACLTRKGAKKPVVAVYIPKGESFTVRHIPDGTYELYFTLGAHWDPAVREFRDDKRYYRFEDLFHFQTSILQTRHTKRRVYRTMYYTAYEVTLYGVINGTARTEEISQSEFPSLQ